MLSYCLKPYKREDCLEAVQISKAMAEADRQNEDQGNEDQSSNSAMKDTPPPPPQQFGGFDKGFWLRKQPNKS